MSTPDREDEMRTVRHYAAKTYYSRRLPYRTVRSLLRLLVTLAFALLVARLILLA
jgi:hypothetical protein